MIRSGWRRWARRRWASPAPMLPTESPNWPGSTHVAENPTAIDLSRPLSVHIVGIGGGAMSGIATVLKAMGHTVTGSDLKDSPGLDRLRALGIPAVVGHAAENIGAADLIAFSAAIPAQNPEMVAAAERHIPVYK